MIYPIRINKYLSDKKIASRRESDEFIKEGRVKINGRKAGLGEMVNETDEVTVEGDLKKTVYLAFNKPEGIITHSPQKGESSIGDILKFGIKVFPVGRLDKDSNGLIILTNDGRITDRMLNPINYHEKEYEVRLDREFDNKFIEKMEQGVKLDDGYVTQKCDLEKLSDSIFSIILTEGKKRQIRRMCLALGYKVIGLKRTRIMNIRLGKLRSGSYRMILGNEKDDFLSALNLENR